MAARRTSLGLDGLLSDPAQQGSREDNWEGANTEAHSEDSHEPPSEAVPSDDRDDYEGDSDMDDDPEPSMTPDRYEHLIYPLQVTVERVGHELEKFAEKLERLHPSNEKDNKKRYERALLLADEYHKIAKETADRLWRQHGHLQERWLKLAWSGINKSKKSGRNGISIADLSTDPASRKGFCDLLHWTEEQRTWDLFRQVAEFQYPRSWVNKEAEIESKLSDLEPIHQYSSEEKIWERFLISNETARERHAILTWLQEGAEETGNDIEIITNELESMAGQGRALWVHGWLHTKEAIKAQKRLRLWPQPLEPSSPGLAATLVKKDKTESLVTQLDPDAVTRQGRVLEQQDEFFEQCMWMVCWEMLRRGKKWSDIREWYRDRVEGWRAVSLRGAEPAWDSATDVNKSIMSDSMLDESDLSQLRDEEPPVAKIEGNRSRALWRRMCFWLARNGGVNDYERAVYGLLGGDLDTVEKVCNNWDDFLFAHYNSIVLFQFDRYLHEHYPDRLSPTMAKRFGLFDSVQFHGDPTSVSRRVVEKLKQEDVTSNEASQPMKLIQGYLICRKFSDLVYQYGLALSKVANMNEPSKIIPALDEARDTQYHLKYLRRNSHDDLRVICHMLIIFKELGFDNGYGDRKIATENNIVAWIDFLRLTGKIDLVPLYSAYLSPERQILTLAAVLRDISSSTVRQELIRLMQAYGIDVPSVIRRQIQDTVKEAGLEEPKTEMINVQIFEEMNSSKPANPTIKRDFIGTEVSKGDLSVIESFEWYLYLDGHWEETFTTGAFLFQRFFLAKRWAAARVLAERMPSSQLSYTKTEPLLGEQADLTGDAYDMEEDIQDQLAQIRLNGPDTEKESKKGRHGGSTSDRRRLTRQVLASQAKLYSEFERLIWALSELEGWRKTLDSAPTPTESHRTKSWRGQVQNAYEKVVRTVEPLLHGWMVDIPAGDARDDDDNNAASLSTLRTSYLPPIILAYHSVLFSAGFLLRPEILTRCMNLSTIIAAPDSDVLQCFVDTGRLPELVKALALSSKGILLTEERKMAKKNNGGVGGVGGAGVGGTGSGPASGNRSSSRKSRRGGGEVMGVWFVRP